MLSEKEISNIETLPEMIVVAEKVATNIIQGSHGRRRVGMGESFWQFRSYMPGDSTRHIDWRQTAKRDSAFIRETEWEASQTIILWLDNSESMNYSSNPDKYMTKQKYGALVLLSLASALLRGGETIMIPGFRPVQGYPSLPHVAEMLLKQNLSLKNLGKIPKDAHGIFVTDAWLELDELAINVNNLSNSRLNAQFIQLLDRAEIELPFAGSVVFEDLEDSASSEKLPDVKAIRDEYKQVFLEHQKSLRKITAAAGWSFSEMVTDMDLAEAVLPIYNNLLRI